MASKLDNQTLSGPRALGLVGTMKEAGIPPPKTPLIKKKTTKLDGGLCTQVSLSLFRQDSDSLRLRIYES